MAGALLSHKKARPRGLALARLGCAIRAGLRLRPAAGQQKPACANTCAARPGPALCAPPNLRSNCAPNGRSVLDPKRPRRIAKDLPNLRLLAFVLPRKKASGSGRHAWIARGGHAWPGAVFCAQWRIRPGNTAQPPKFCLCRLAQNRKNRALHTHRPILP